MPNIWTHILFCEEIMEVLDNPLHFQDAQNYLNLGAQGPDPFFYHNFLPWKKDDRVNQVGEVLHKKNCGSFLMDFIRASTTESSTVKAYVLGFVSHHILDRNTHPYIHYHAGYEENKHQRLEIIIDTLMMEKFRNLRTWKVPVYQEIDVGKKIDPTIEKTLESLISRYYKQDLKELPSHYIQISYRQMKLALKILFDPNGWKNKVASRLISPFSHQPIKEEKDYLNEGRNSWHHPATNDVHNESFLQLYDRAKKEGIEVLAAVIKFWRNPTTEQEQIVESLIDDISYDTGERVSDNLVLQYANPIV